MCNTILFCLFNIYIFARLGSRVGENILHTLCETSAKWVKVKESHYKCLMWYSFIRDIDFPQAQNQDPKFEFFFFSLWLFFFFAFVCFPIQYFRPISLPLTFLKNRENKKTKACSVLIPKPSTNQHRASCGIFISGDKKKKQNNKKSQEEEKRAFWYRSSMHFVRLTDQKIVVGFFYLRYEIRNFVYC